ATVLRGWIVRRIHDIVTGPVMGEAFEHLEPRARDLRRTWYEERAKAFDDQAAQSGQDVDVARVSAFGRLQATAIKVACLSPISRDDRRDISKCRVGEREVAFGIWLAEYGLSALVDVAERGGMTPDDVCAERVVSWLRRRNGAGPATKKTLLDAVRITGMR